MRVSPRRSDDADVIRARLRALLAEGSSPRGWLPDDLQHDRPHDGPDELAGDDAGPADDELPPSTGSGTEVPDGPGAADGPAPRPLGVALGRHRAPGPAVRMAPGRTGVWALAAAGLLAVVLLLLWTWWDRPTVTPVPAAPPSATARPSAAPRTPTGPTPAGTPAVGEAASTSAPVVVSVVGLVAHPGLVTLPAGARVSDAVIAAGGLVAPADPASVNLAAVVADGQQIAVGLPAAAGPTSGAATGAGTRSTGAGSAAGAGPVDLNAATAAVLDGLPGIGPVLAQRIVDFRAQHGRFSSVDQLDDVPGIGPALYARLAGQVRV